MGVRPAKRAGLLGSTFVVLLLVLLVAIPAVYALPGPPRQHNQDSAAPSPGRAGGEYDVKLYLRSNGASGNQTLNTTAGTTQTQRNPPVEFVLAHPLDTSVEVLGKDMSQGSGKGMWVYFQITGVPRATTITIQITQSDTVIANMTEQISGVTSVRRWDVPFVSDESSHTFPAGSVIKVSVAASFLCLLQFNTADSYLWMPMTSPPIVPALGTYYAPGKASTEFAPYADDSTRRIRTEGDIVSVFGPSDIHAVTVTIRNPSGEVASNGSAQVTAQHYVNTWNYSRGQVPGNYNVTVTVQDQQGHDYPAYTVVTMLRYAVFIGSPQKDVDDIVKGVASPPRGGSEEKDAVYSLLILNSGYSATTATVHVSSDPPPGWTATLSTATTASINPGSTANVTFTVSPNSDVDFGNRAVIYVEAIADGDTRTPKASWTIQTLTNATMSRNLDFSLTGVSETWVDVGQTATYQMLARNKGVLDMNVSFTASGAPIGWTAVLDVAGLVHLDTGSNSEKTVTLKVTAPAEEVANLSRVAQVTVSAQVLEDATLEKQVTTVTRLITILGLSVSPGVMTSDPTVLGGRVDFHATISNMDPLMSHPIRLTVTPPGDWPLSSVSYSPHDSLLSPNTTTTILVSVTPPANAEANTDSGYTVTVKAEPTDQPTRSNTTNMIVKVKPRYEISMEISQGAIDAAPGQKVTATITVKNLGNSNNTVVLYVAAGYPTDWKVQLDNVSAPNPYTVQLASSSKVGAMQTITITIQPAKKVAADSTVKISVTAASPAPEQNVAVKVTVRSGTTDKLIATLTDPYFLLIVVLCVVVLSIFSVVRRRSARTA